MSTDETAELLARARRLQAQMYRVLAARADMEAAAAEAVIQMRDIAAQFTEAERREIAEHPDLAELNVQLDGFYRDHG